MLLRLLLVNPKQFSQRHEKDVALMTGVKGTLD